MATPLGKTHVDQSGDVTSRPVELVEELERRIAARHGEPPSDDARNECEEMQRLERDVARELNEMIEIATIEGRPGP